MRHSAFASRSAFDSVMKLLYTLLPPLLPLLPSLLLLLPPPSVLETLSEMLPNSRLAPMPAKPSARPNWVEGTLWGGGGGGGRGEVGGGQHGGQGVLMMTTFVS